MTLLLGKLAAEDDTRTLSFERYFKGGLSGLPETFGNYQPVNEWRMLLNDKLGDCVPAACIHQIMLWLYETDRAVQAQFTDRFAQLAYEGMAGYVPGRPETDRGTVMLRAMRWWQQYGIAGPGGRAHKLTAYAGVPLDLDIMRRALWLCNGLCIGLQLPKSAMEQFDNNQPWTYVPGSEVVGGHCVTLVGWDPEWFYFVTWGKLWKMSYEFALAKGMIDEMFACIAVDVMRHGESPQHLKLEELIRDVESVTQRSA